MIAWLSIVCSLLVIWLIHQTLMFNVIIIYSIQHFYYAFFAIIFFQYRSDKFLSPIMNVQPFYRNYIETKSKETAVVIVSTEQ